MKNALAAMFAAVLAACAAPSPDTQPRQGAFSAATPMIKLYESPCYFPTCITYEIELRPDGSYRLTDRKATNPDPVQTGTLGPDAWAKAEAALAAANFASMPEQLTVSTLMRPGGVACINDLPDVEFTRHGDDGSQKTVHFSTGCNVPEARKLLADLRTLFRRDEPVKKN